MKIERVIAIMSVVAVIVVPYGVCAREMNVQPGVSAYGIASWYSEDDPGILPTTANMELFNDQELTCAIWDVPFHTLIRVTNLANGKAVIVRVNDRGPAKRLVRQGRIIDLTKSAFGRIASLDEGLIEIKMEILPQVTAALQ